MSSYIPGNRAADTTRAMPDISLEIHIPDISVNYAFNKPVS